MRKTAIGAFVLILSLFLFHPINAAIVTHTILFDATPGSSLVDNVEGYEFSVTTDDPSWTFAAGDAIPAGASWFIFDVGSPIQALSLDDSTLVTGELGTITYDDVFSLVLGDWILGDANNEALVQGVDYFIGLSDTNTTTISAIPIPSTALLLGGGAFFLLLLKRKNDK